MKDRWAISVKINRWLGIPKDQLQIPSSPRPPPPTLLWLKFWPPGTPTPVLLASSCPHAFLHLRLSQVSGGCPELRHVRPLQKDPHLSGHGGCSHSPRPAGPPGALGGGKGGCVPHLPTRSPRRQLLPRAVPSPLCTFQSRFGATFSGQLSPTALGLAFWAPSWQDKTMWVTFPCVVTRNCCHHLLNSHNPAARPCCQCTVSGSGPGPGASQTFAWNAHEAPLGWQARCPRVTTEGGVRGGRVAEQGPVAAEGQSGWLSGGDSCLWSCCRGTVRREEKIGTRPGKMPR